MLRRSEITERLSRLGTEKELYVKFTIEEWKKRAVPIALGGQRIYTVLYTTKYMFDRVLEIAELKLDREEDLQIWREKRRLGKVKVRLDNTFADLAQRVVDVEVGGL